MSSRKRRRQDIDDDAPVVAQDVERADAESASAVDTVATSDAADAAPTDAATVHTPRMIMYTGSSDYKLDRVHAVYKIECLHGDAFHFSKDMWYAIALEVNGKRVSFHKSEQVVMKVIDERDPEAGAAILTSRLSEQPWRDGKHYFSAVVWDQVGEFRLTFHLRNARKDWAELDIQPLSYNCVATDPEWEAELYRVLASETDEALQDARHGSFALQPLTGPERAWLSEHGGMLPRDPPHHVLLELSAAMSSDLRLPAVKDVSVLAPLFESSTGRSKRLALERQRKQVLRQHQMMQRSRMMLTGGKADRAPPAPTRRASPAVVSTSQLESAPVRKHPRKGVTPMRLAGRDEHAATYDAIQQWQAAVADEDRKAVARALGRAPSLHSQRAAATEDRRLASAALLQALSRRIYRYDAIPAGHSQLLWCTRLAPRVMLQELAGVSADMLSRACASISKQLQGMLTVTAQGARRIRVEGDDKKVAAFRYMYGLKPMRAAAAPAVTMATAAVSAAEADVTPVPEPAEGTMQVDLPPAVLSASDAWIVLLRSLGSVDTAAVPSYMHLARFLQAAPSANAHATLEAMFMDLSKSSSAGSGTAARRRSGEK